MRRHSLESIVLATACLLMVAAPAAAFPHRLPDALDGVDTCPVTRTNGVAAFDDNGPGRSQGDYGDEALWTNLWMWGESEVLVDSGHQSGAGEAVDLKWAWYRFVAGKLAIDGRRLDGEAAPLRAWIPDGYGLSGFQVSGITFPTPGCWQVTGRLLDVDDPAIELGRLTFMVRVVYAGE